MADEPRDEPPKSRGGRPRVAVPRSSSVSAWLPTHEHDRLIALARKSDQSVSSVVRQLLAARLR